VLPAGLDAVIDRRWVPQPVFGWLATTGAIETEEMLAVFNCGIGMVLVVPDAAAATAALIAQGETPILLGHIASSTGAEPAVRWQTEKPDFAA
jgi:phosphoribosylformylglycinamidine cyclo-ligase